MSTLAYLAPLGPFALFWLAQVATPGPNFVRISHTALAVSRSAAAATACGTALGNSIWCAIAAVGAAALLGEGWLGLVLRGVGALYLAFFGVRLLKGALLRRATAGAPTGWQPPRGGLPAVRTGLVTSLTNPQAVIFFATIFLASFPVARDGLLAAAVAVTAAVTLFWYALVIGVLAAPRPRAIYLRARPLIDAAFGLLLIAAAARLALAILS